MWHQDVQNREGLIQPSITGMCKAGYSNEECPAFLLYARQQQAIVTAQESGSTSLLKIRDEFTQNLLFLSDVEYLVT